MGLVDELMAEQDRRRNEKIQVLETEKRRREGPGVFGAIAKKAPSGLTRAIGIPGRGLEAVGTSLQHPRRELTVKEYHAQSAEQTGKNLARQVAESEEPLVDEQLQGGPISIEERAAWNLATGKISQEELAEALTPDKDFRYLEEKSTMGSRHISLTNPVTGKKVKTQYEDILPEDMTPLRRGMQKAKSLVGRPLEVAGEFYGDWADKTIESNPQWKLPEHLEGRGVLEILAAEDLSFHDKMVGFVGGVTEQLPQLIPSLGLATGGFLIAGPPGGIAGAGMGLGYNFLAETGGVYDDLIKTYPDLNRADAANTAIVHGFVASALEVAPMGTLLARLPGVKRAVMGGSLRELLRKPHFTKRLISGMATQGLTEGVTEGLQEISANVAKGVYEQNPQYFKNIDESVFMGFILGVLTGGISSLATQRSAVKQFNDERLAKLNSDQLFELASNPDLLDQENISKDEVIAVAEQIRIVEGLQNIQEKRDKEGVSLEALAGSESEQAARYLTRIRNADRSVTTSKARAMVREKNLSTRDLNLLIKKPKALERYGLTPEDITSLVEERTEEKQHVKYFDDLLAKAPSDSVRQGIMDSLQGAYHQGLTRVIEAQGKDAARSDLMKGPVKISKPKPKVKPKVKPKKKVEGPTKDDITLLKVHKTKAAAIVAINNLKDKDSFYILKNKEGFFVKRKKVEPKVVPGRDFPLASMAKDASVPFETAAKDQGLIFNGVQEMPQMMKDKGFTDQYLFTDSKTKSTFAVNTVEEVPVKLKEMRAKFTEADKALRSDPKFSRWFKQSEATDTKGKPQVAYHGTSALIESFDPDKLGTTTGVRSAKNAFFFSTEPSHADQFAFLAQRRVGGNPAVYPVYLSIQNPLKVDLSKHTVIHGLIGDKVLEAKEGGYDGVIFTNSYDSPQQGYLTIDNELFDFDFRGSDFDYDIDAYHKNPTDKGYDAILKQLEITKDFYADDLKNAPGNEIAEIQKEKVLWDKALKAWKDSPTRLQYAAPPSGTTYAVFNNTQIKSIFNKGEYDPDNADILADTESVSLTDIGKRLTADEVDTEVRAILGDVPDFIKIQESIDPDLEHALDNRALASRARPLNGLPIWKSRIEDKIAGKKGPGHKTAQAWLTALEQWTTDKVKKGEVVKGSAEFSGPVQDQLYWSGLVEWLEDRKDFDIPTTGQDIKEFLEDHDRFYFDEKTLGFDIGLHMEGIHPSGMETAPWETMVLNDGSRSTKYRIHLFNMPKGRVKRWVLTNPNGTIIPGYKFDSIEKATKELKDAHTAFDKNLTLTQIYEYEPHPDEKSVLHTSEIHFKSMSNYIHVRADERFTKEDLRTLFLNEIQSDWTQKSGKYGYENKSKFNTLMARAKTMEVILSDDFKKSLDIIDTAHITEDPTTKKIYKIFRETKSLKDVGFTDYDIAELSYGLSEKMAAYPDDDLKKSLIEALKDVANTIWSPANTYVATQTEASGFARYSPEGMALEAKAYNKLASTILDAGYESILINVINENRSFDNIIHQEYRQGYEGLTEETFKALKHHFTRSILRSYITADDIEALTPVAFRSQFKKLRKIVYLAEPTYELLSRAQLEKLQGLIVLYARAGEFSSTITKPPMPTTWESYILKRMVQQAILEGQEYVAWPGTANQVGQIEGFGNLTKTDDGRYWRGLTAATQQELKEKYKTKDLTEAIKLHEKVYKQEGVRKALLLPEYKIQVTGNVTSIVNRYIQKLPRAAKKLFKRYGVKVEPIELQLANQKDPWNKVETAPDPVMGFKLTPELTDAVLNKEIPLASHKGEVRGLYSKKKIYLFADTIRSVNEVKGLLIHEGGHWLRRNDKEYQKKFGQLMDQFWKLAADPSSSAEAAAIASALDQASKESDVLSNELVHEEALMYFLENQANEKFNLWQEFKNLIKQWLHKLGISPETLNMTGPQMADVIVRDLRKHIQEKKAEAKKVDAEVAQEVQEAEVLASKRKDIKQYKRSKADNILDDLFGVPKEVRKTKGFHEADYVQANDFVAKNVKDEKDKAIAKLTGDIIKGDVANVKAFKRGKHEQTSSWLNRIFSSPEYYFSKDTTAKRILDIAKRKNDIKHEWKNKVEGDFIAVVKETKKKNLKAYVKANNYLLNTDKTGKGFRLVQAKDGKWVIHNLNNNATERFNKNKEKEAVEAMIQAELAYLKTRGWNKDALTVLEEARRLTNRGFDLTVEDMRRQIQTNKDQGIEEPTIIYEDDEGVKNELSLSEAIAMMGDLRGTYFPRERQAKGYTLQATAEGKPNILLTYDAYMPLNVRDFASKEALKKAFNKLTPVGRKIRELEKTGYTDMILSPVRNPTGILFDVPGLLKSMDDLLTASDERLSDDEMTKYDKIYLQKVSEQLTLRIADIYKAKGQLSSRMRRANILWEGYEEDALKALASYAQRVSTGAAMRQTAREMLLTFTGREIPWKTYKEDNPDASYRSYRIMVKKKAINASTQKNLYEDVRTYMTYMLSPDSRLDRIIGYAKAAATLKFLGFRMSSAAINMTNMGMAVPATMSAHTGLSITRSWGYVGEAASKYALWRLEQLELTSDLTSTMQRKIKRLNKGVVLSDRDRAIFAEISRRGWDEAQFNHDAARVLQDSTNRTFDMALRVAMYMFGATEKANRAMTIFAAFKAHEAAQKKKGTKRSDEFYLKMAQHVSDRAHGTYGKAAKPWLVQKARPLDLLYTFQKFQHNYLLNMTEIGVKGLQNRKKLASMKNITYMLLTPAIVAGTGATLLAKFAFKLIKELFDKDDPEEDFYNWFDETFGEDTFWSRAARHGATGALFHINLRGSIQMNSPIPTDLKEIAGAPGSIATDIYDSIVHFSKHEWMKGAEKFGPTFTGSMLKAIRESTEGLTTKGYLPVYYGPNALKANPIDAALRFASFNPSRLSAIREKQWREIKVTEAYTMRRTEIKEQIRRMLVQGTANEVKWADIFNQVQEYNDRVMAAPKRYIVTRITDDWLIQTIRDIYTPKKAEKLRTISRGK